jgi:hypothetical protein
MNGTNHKLLKVRAQSTVQKMTVDERKRARGKGEKMVLESR